MDSVYKPPRPSGFVKFLPESFSTHKFGSALNWLHLHANRKKASKLAQAHNWKGSLIHWAADTCASTISAKTITCHWFKSTHSWSVELTCGQLFDLMSSLGTSTSVWLTQEWVKKKLQSAQQGLSILLQFQMHAQPYCIEGSGILGQDLNSLACVGTLIGCSLSPTPVGRSENCPWLKLFWSKSMAAVDQCYILTFY